MLVTFTHHAQPSAGANAPKLSQSVLRHGQCHLLHVAELESLGTSAHFPVTKSTSQTKKNINMKKTSIIISAVIAFLATVPPTQAASISLTNATATFSQSVYNDFSVAKSIDGIGDDLGWAILAQAIGGTDPQSAVYETTTDVGFLSGTVVTFQLMQFHSNSGHTFGRFRLSLTTDDRSLFADGLSSGGDVTANWTVLDIDSAISTNGATLTELGDHSILASGLATSTDTSTITATTSMTAITGVRIEALEDVSLPSGGPRRYSANGNFVLSEFTMDATVVPEPSTVILLLSGLALCLRRRTGFKQ